VILAAALIVLVARTGLLSTGKEGRIQSRDYAYAELAEQVRGKGFNSGTILAPEPIVAGYLKLHFPQAVVCCGKYPIRPTTINGPGCILVVDAAPCPAQGVVLIKQFGFDPLHTQRLEVIQGPKCAFSTKQQTVGFVILE
jgi:hypothetical protein